MYAGWKLVPSTDQASGQYKGFMIIAPKSNHPLMADLGEYYWFPTMEQAASFISAYKGDYEVQVSASTRARSYRRRKPRRKG